ncbi:MAG: DUF5618 family protein [Bacteroidota bacterium]
MKTERTHYEEALRYIDNAEEQLKKSGKDGKYYTDIKYVKSAGGIAYVGVEKAAKWYIELNEKKIASNADDREIRKLLSKINKKALNLFAGLYSYLHEAVYYNGNNNIAMIKESLSEAKKFIAYLKPYNKIAIYKGGGKIKNDIKKKSIVKKK